MKKPRGDAKLKTLPDALQEQLWQLLRRTTVEKATVWLKTTHGVETSAAALSQFFSWYPRQATLRSAASFADQLKATVAKLPELAVTADQAASIAQVAFEIQAAQDKDPKLFIDLQYLKTKKAELALKAQAQDLRLRQYEEKIEKARESLEKAKSKGGISKETLALIEQQLKLL